DLQEPLRKISTFTERLNTKFDSILGQEGSMFLKRILSATASMQTLLEDLLSFSRLSFDEKKFEKVSVNSCIESVIADLEVKIEETKTVISCDRFPEIEAYPSQIKQLFNNLIGNAIKFRKPGAACTINIASHKVEQQDFMDLPLTKGVNYVKITVTDNGIGFDQEFSEKIFMIFQRLNGKAEYAGSGVGLAICKKIVDNHHGFIFANSKPDHGASFTILLPKIQS
ncbi:MAG TPA: ATP-binding protein, partial [Bacteroidia bacterium]|nr:ATP-binding protein [Bacteroidia bacterium]